MATVPGEQRGHLREESVEMAVRPFPKMINRANLSN